MPSGVQLTSAEDARIRSLWEKGCSVAEIRLMHGYSATTIRKVIHDITTQAREGTKGGSRNRIPDEIRRSVRELNREGMYSHSQLASMAGISESSVVAILNEVPQPYVHAPYQPKSVPDVYMGTIPFPTKERLMAGR